MDIERVKLRTAVCERVGLTLEASRMGLDDAWLTRMAAPLGKALDAMEALEKGAVANPDEKRQVGHYWLRDPDRAPTPAMASAIRSMQAEVKRFASEVHSGVVAPPQGGRFDRVLVIGIGGSTLGPQLVSDALAPLAAPMQASFLDNTDPDGFDRTFARIGDGLSRTLTVVISKSGGTKETRNGMLEARRAYEARGLDFGKHAVAITEEGSELDRVAVQGGWLRRFPMWDWVGGRTSELSAVGLVPAALQGIDIEAMLAGAREADACGRSRELRQNPAALLALSWHHAESATARKAMVVLPYRDSLLLLPRYLQQLVMESLGKELDRAGRVVHEGITVYGNKGSTDQHAYVQQLREGPDDFFVLFVQVRKDREGPSMEVEPGVTSGDYLLGFLLGTRQALFEKGRGSLLLTLDDAGPRSLGAVLSVFERAVGIYAELRNVNAYHQPGVEAGKKAAAGVLDLQKRLVAKLDGTARSAAELAAAAGTDDVETAFRVLDHLAAGGRLVAEEGRGMDARFRLR